MGIHNFTSRWVDKILIGTCAMSVTLACGCRRLPETVVSPSPALYGYEACDTADSPAICAQVQKCFASAPVEACRDAERTANQLSKPNSQLFGPNGASDALKY